MPTGANTNRPRTLTPAILNFIQPLISAVNPLFFESVQMPPTFAQISICSNETDSGKSTGNRPVMAKGDHEIQSARFT
jgi:hypothetical protein